MTREAEPASAAEPPLVVIRPSTGWVRLELGELWRYRELLLVFTWRNIVVRYKQTVLGVTWAIVQPVLLMTVFSLANEHERSACSEAAENHMMSFWQLVNVELRLRRLGVTS